MYAPTLIADQGNAYPAPRGLRVQAAATAGIGGLDRFVYLRGTSGQRYVFSAVTQERAALYDDCVFAWRDAGASLANPCAEPPRTARGGQLYVHLADDADPAIILADLRSASDV